MLYTASGTHMFLAIICVFITSSIIQGCDPPYTSFEKSCYQLVSFTKSNWNHSEEYCKRHDAHLVSVTSQDEYDFIINLIENATRTREVWIGLHHKNLASSGAAGNGDLQGWMWSDGSPYSFSKWASQEPDAGDQYVRIQNGEWIGVGTHDQPHHFVCEKDESKRVELILTSSTTTSIAPFPGPRDSRDEPDPTVSTTLSTTTSSTTTTTTPSTTTTTPTTTTTTPTTTTTTPTTTTTTPTTTTTTPTTTTTTPTPITTTPTTTMTTTETTTTPSTTKTSTASPESTSTKTETESTTTSPTTPNLNTLRVDKNNGNIALARNIGIILGCVLGFLFVAIIGAIICIVAKNSKSCCPKTEDDYVEPLKGSSHGPTDEQVVGDMLTQGNSNVYIELHDGPLDSGQVTLAGLGNTSNGISNATYERMQYQNTPVEENIYDSIRQNGNPIRGPNPYYNT